MSHRKKVEDAITAIDKGPKVLKLYMEMCAKCGTCASQCPVYFGKADKKYNPAARSDLIRGIYKRLTSSSGRFLRLYRLPPLRYLLSLWYRQLGHYPQGTCDPGSVGFDATSNEKSN